MSSVEDGQATTTALLAEILSSLKLLQKEHVQLSSAVDAISGKVNVLTAISQPNGSVRRSNGADTPTTAGEGNAVVTERRESAGDPLGSPTLQAVRRGSLTSKITLTTYPGQSNVDPIPLIWGHPDTMSRGPVVVARGTSTIRKRNGACSAAVGS